MDHGSASAQRSALVAYGSETGTALDYAEELGRVLERLHFMTNVCTLDNTSLSTFTLVLVVTSTTGQGDLPNNSKSFWRSLLRKKLSRHYLEGVPFTSFGLGDSSYPRYNWAVKKIHKRLLQLGAREVCSRGEADEQHEEGLDGSFVPWAVDFRRRLLDLYPLPEGLDSILEDVLLPPKWMLCRVETQRGVPNGYTANGRRAIDGNITVELVENRRLTPSSHWQDVRQLSFSSKTQASYVPGDVLTIYPKNTTEDVQHIVDLMQWGDVAEELVTLARVNVPNAPSNTTSAPPIQALPEAPMTFRQMLLSHLDLMAIPRRSFFSLISHFTNDLFQKERLLEFTKPEYVDELFDYTTRPRRSVLEVLQEFDTVKIPWQWAANVLPELRGRQFSIASGGQLKQDPGGCARFELLVAIVKYRTVIKKMREGVCTKYLASMKPGSQLSATLQKGGLGITKANVSKPIVVIGPGTGVAPIRSLLWERLRWTEDLRQVAITRADNEADGHEWVGKSLLIYGCRNESADYFYRDEWKLLAAKVPLEVHAAFSRDQSSKIYVQDVVRQRKVEIYRLLHNLEGVVFVCGSSGKMPTAVRTALTDVFRDCGSMTQSDAEAYLETMEKEGRYKQETWA